VPSVLFADASHPSPRSLRWLHKSCWFSSLHANLLYIRDYQYGGGLEYLTRIVGDGKNENHYLCLKLGETLREGYNAGTCSSRLGKSQMRHAVTSSAALGPETVWARLRSNYTSEIQPRLIVWEGAPTQTSRPLACKRTYRLGDRQLAKFSANFCG
jgi:hypothetical protein